MITETSAPIERLDAYEHNGFPWVPHYLKPNTYVAPGGMTLTETALIAIGAQKTEMLLWPRRWCRE